MTISDTEFLQLKAQVEALEDESGTDPSGSFSTVRDRLDSIQSEISSITLGSSIALAGDLSGTTDNAVVEKINGFPFNISSPQDTYVITWNESAGQFEAQPQIAFTASGDLFGSSLTQTVIGLQGRALANTAPTNGQVIAWNGTLSTWEPVSVGSGNFFAGGDLSGSDNNQVVIGIQTVPVSASAPSNGDALIFDGTSWSPGAVASGFTAANDLSGDSTTQTVIGIQSVPVSATLPTDGYTLIYNDTIGEWQPKPAPVTFTAGGDLSGNESSQNVIAIQNVPIGVNPPSDGQVLTYDSGIGEWGPADPTGGSGGQNIIQVLSGIFSFSGLDYSGPVVVGHFRIDTSLNPGATYIMGNIGKITDTVFSDAKIYKVSDDTLIATLSDFISSSGFDLSFSGFTPDNGDFIYEIRFEPSGATGVNDGFVLTELYIEIS